MEFAQGTISAAAILDGQPHQTVERTIVGPSVCAEMVRGENVKAPTLVFAIPYAQESIAVWLISSAPLFQSHVVLLA